MPVDLADLVAPAHTAVLTMELQRGVVGDAAAIAALRDEVAARGVVDAAARLVTSARRAGVRVVHCTAEFRADRAGSATNAPLLAALAKGPVQLLSGSEAAAVVPALGPEPEDLISSRQHGISPFTGTALDAWLRNLGVTTVVVAGVSVNLGVLGLCIEAVNLGYRVAVASDAVAGVPREYADDVLRNTIALLATCRTVEEITAAW
jgi:nicotinamidase-related amidase